ncbi:MAG: hypothetical protein HYZ50_04490 [Deltaproteobacteria bacterium]|nr:hypothetical protein [Deltaproteobacteria bacterium]
MDIQLTPQQQHALNSHTERPPRVIDPCTNSAYILVLERDYETMHELLDDERRQQAIHRVALHNAMGRMHEEP